MTTRVISSRPSDVYLSPRNLHLYYLHRLQNMNLEKLGWYRASASACFCATSIYSWYMDASISSIFI